jgi:hypothetical protein
LQEEPLDNFLFILIDYSNYYFFSLILNHR